MKIRREHEERKNPSAAAEFPRWITAEAEPELQYGERLCDARNGGIPPVFQTLFHLFPLRRDIFG